MPNSQHTHKHPRREFIDRLCKICGMLGSDHDGERAAAALKASDMLRAAGLTWPDVLKPRDLPEHPADKRDERSSLDALLPREMISECLRWPHLLTPWQVNFLVNVNRRRDPPSDKQVVVLRTIAEIVWRAGGFR